MSPGRTARWERRLAERLRRRAGAPGSGRFQNRIKGRRLRRLLESELEPLPVQAVRGPHLAEALLELREAFADDGLKLVPLPSVPELPDTFAGQ
jgi:hypothetical protein